MKLSGLIVLCSILISLSDAANVVPRSLIERLKRQDSNGDGCISECNDSTDLPLLTDIGSCPTSPDTAQIACMCGYLQGLTNACETCYASALGMSIPELDQYCATDGGSLTSMIYGGGATSDSAGPSPTSNGSGGGSPSSAAGAASTASAPGSSPSSSSGGGSSGGGKSGAAVGLEHVGLPSLAVAVLSVMAGVVLA